MDKFKYVMIYSGYCSLHKAVRYYLRFVPPNCDLESMGFPHGLSMTQSFPTREDAEAFAPNLERFFETTIVNEASADFDGSFDLIFEKDCVDLGIVDNSLLGLNPFELFDQFIKNDIKIEKNYMDDNKGMVLMTSKGVYFLSYSYSDLNSSQIRECLFKMVKKIRQKEPVKFTWS